MKTISNCKKATFLIEKKQIGFISTREELGLQLHLANCSLCRGYQHQSIMINQFVHELQVIKFAKLDYDLKKEMQKQIIEALSK